MKALPYFKWYPADAEMDDNFRAMDDAEIGFYIRCLDHAWLNGGLPADPAERARRLKTRQSVADRRWIRVGKCFRPHPSDATLCVNPRQESERQLALQKSEVGVESANRRWVANATAADIRNASALARAESDADAASAASSVLNSNTETNTTPRAREPEPPTPPEPPPVQPEVLTPPPTNGNGRGNGNVLPFGLPTLERQTEYPETVRAVHDYFPDCDLGFCHKLVHAAGHAYACVADPQCALSDSLIAEAVRRVHKPSQDGAGLFTRTVPECIRTWATEGVRARAGPPRAQSTNDRAIEMLKERLAAKAAKEGGR